MKRKNAPVTWITTLALLLSMCASLTFSQRTAAQSGDVPASQSAERDQAGVNYPTLSKYATDLTLLALRGKLETIRGHEADIARVVASLATTAKAPVVVGESDLDRDAIARGVAMKIAFGDVPENLRNKRVFRLSLDALAKGAKTSDEFVSRVQAVFAEAEAAQGRVILFVDQLHEYAGNARDGDRLSHSQGRNRSESSPGYRRRGPEAYSNYIATDESVAKLFEPISIDRVAETVSESTVSKDKRKSPINEEFEGEKISSDMRELMESVGPNGRVTAILQVDDVHSAEVSALLKRYGVNVDARMAQLGAMKVELPAKAIEALAKSRAA